MAVVVAFVLEAYLFREQCREDYDGQWHEESAYFLFSLQDKPIVKRIFNFFYHFFN